MRSRSRNTSYGAGSWIFDAEVATQGLPVNGIEALMTDALLRSGRLHVMERQKVSKVLKEQDFGASGVLPLAPFAFVFAREISG